MLIGRNIFKNFNKTTLITVDTTLNSNNKMEKNGVVVFYDDDYNVSSIILNNCDFFVNNSKDFFTLNQTQNDYVLKAVAQVSEQLKVSNKPKFQFGKIVERVSHPKSEKLFIIDVFNGQQTIKLVTNTTDSQKNAVVVFANLGAQTYSGIDVKVSELMGVKSPGMLVGYKTLGIMDQGDDLIFGDDNLIGKEFQI